MFHRAESGRGLPRQIVSLGKLENRRDICMDAKIKNLNLSLVVYGGVYFNLISSALNPHLSISSAALSFKIFPTTPLSLSLSYRSRATMEERQHGTNAGSRATMEEWRHGTNAGV